MASHNSLRRAVSGLVLLAAFAAVTDAEAQRRRMPVRTEPIPDTETGGKAGSAGSIEAQDPKAQEPKAQEPKPPDPKPQNPGMMIYGPPVPVLGAPPLPPVPAAVTTPAPAPVVTPLPATPAPVAVPVPAPVPPPAPVAVPIPAPVPPPVPLNARPYESADRGLACHLHCILDTRLNASKWCTPRRPRSRRETQVRARAWHRQLSRAD